MVHLLVFHAYINEMQVQEAKSPVNNLVRQRCAEGFNSGVKGLKIKLVTHTKTRIDCEIQSRNAVTLYVLRSTHNMYYVGIKGNF
jgi:hypothetical protein